MPYDPNIPMPNDDLSDSQVDLLANFQQLDTSFGIDHYTFSNATANNGKHNQVTTPVQGSHPATSANEPKFYAMQDSANLGVIQYSRAGSSAVPSPMTYLQSTSAAIPMVQNVAINIFDFTGLTRAMCMFSAFGTSGANTARIAAAIHWTGTSLFATSLGGVFFTVGVSGNILTLTTSLAAGASAYWTLQFLRSS